MRDEDPHSFSVLKVLKKNEMNLEDIRGVVALKERYGIKEDAQML